MAFDFKFPDVGEGIHEGTIVKWRVKEGDTINADVIIAEVETDKAVVEIPSPKTGTVLKLYGAEGGKINVGDVLMTIGEKGEAVNAVTAKPAPSSAPAPAEQAGRGVGVVGDLEEAPADGSLTPMIPVQPSLHVQTSTTQPTAPQVLPRIRMLARELNVDLTHLTGTGTDGRITEQDVRNAVSGGAPASTQSSGLKVQRKYDFYGHIKRIPYTGIRKTIGEHMVKSFYTAVHVTHHDMVDMTKLWELRQTQKKTAEEQGIKLNFLPFIVHAAIRALEAFPMMNASLNEEDAEIIVKEYFNIGIAVSTDDGLMVPVIKVAQKKDIFQLAKGIQELSEKCRARTINMGELKGGSFTITNYGSIGGMFATPVINHPEASILGIGKIKDMPWVVDGQVVSRKIMGISVTYDHRIIDGGTTAQFMNKLIEELENPEGLLQI